MQPIHTNAISTLTLNNLVDKGPESDSHCVPITLRRLTAPLDLVPPLYPEPDSTPELALPSRTPVDLPPPGNANVTLVIKALIGEGATGKVYSVDVVDSTADGCAPPLVVKVARLDRIGHISREAWFYDELAVLQGVCISRCYGWFEAELPRGCSFVKRKRSKLGDDMQGEMEYGLEDGMEAEEEAEEAEKKTEKEADAADDTEENLEEGTGDDMDDDSISDYSAESDGKYLGPKIVERSHLRTRISLLLLEQVGREISLKVPVPIRVKNVWIAMATDLCHLYIDHCDIKYSNVLPSPRTGKRYSWRLIDLELCEKFKVGIPWLIQNNVSEVEGLCAEVEWQSRVYTE